MNTNEIREKVERDPDFVNLPRFEYSLARALVRYPEGLPERLIQEALGLVTKDEVDALYERAVRKLRRAMKVRP